MLINFNHIHQAVLHLIISSRKNDSIQKEYRIFKISSAITKYFDGLNKNTLNYPNKSKFDIEGIKSIENKFYQLQSHVEVFLKEFIGLLDNIVTDQKPDLNVIEEIHYRILDLNAKIKKTFEFISDNPRSMRVYSNFVGAMLNDEDLAKLTEKRIIQYEDKVKV